MPQKRFALSILGLPASQTRQTGPSVSLLSGEAWPAPFLTAPHQPGHCLHVGTTESGSPPLTGRSSPPSPADHPAAPTMVPGQTLQRPHLTSAALILTTECPPTPLKEGRRSCQVPSRRPRACVRPLPAPPPILTTCDDWCHYCPSDLRAEGTESQR